MCLLTLSSICEMSVFPNEKCSRKPSNDIHGCTTSRCYSIVCFVPLPHLLSEDMHQLIIATGGQTSTWPLPNIWFHTQCNCRSPDLQINRTQTFLPTCKLTKTDRDIYVHSNYPIQNANIPSDCGRDTRVVLYKSWLNTSQSMRNSAAG